MINRARASFVHLRSNGWFGVPRSTGPSIGAEAFRLARTASSCSELTLSTGVLVSTVGSFFKRAFVQGVLYHAVQSLGEKSGVDLKLRGLPDQSQDYQAKTLQESFQLIRQLAIVWHISIT